MTRENSRPIPFKSDEASATRKDRRLATTAGSLALATLLVSIAQGLWFVHRVQVPLHFARADTWEIDATGKMIGLNLALGVAPFAVAFGISTLRRQSLIRQISAILLANGIGAAGSFLIFGMPIGEPVGPFDIAGSYFFLGIVAYSLALLVRPRHFPGRTTMQEPPTSSRSVTAESPDA